jgi:hypothetical protein
VKQELLNYFGATGFIPAVFSVVRVIQPVVFLCSFVGEPQHINWKHNFKIIMDAVEDYARRWIKREVDQDPELESLSD